jgi:hypothetical protein
VRRIQDQAFHQLNEAERREMLNTLNALHPARAEALAIELVEQRGMLRGENLEQTRVLASRLLGAHSRSSAALDALKQARSAWFGGSDALKSALDDAARAIEARLATAAESR